MPLGGLLSLMKLGKLLDYGKTEQDARAALPLDHSTPRWLKKVGPLNLSHKQRKEK